MVATLEDAFGINEPNILKTAQQLSQPQNKMSCQRPDGNCTQTTTGDVVRELSQNQVDATQIAMNTQGKVVQQGQNLSRAQQLSQLGDTRGRAFAMSHACSGNTCETFINHMKKCSACRKKVKESFQDIKPEKNFLDNVLENEDLVRLTLIGIAIYLLLKFIN